MKRLAAVTHAAPRGAAVSREPWWTLSHAALVDLLRRARSGEAMERKVGMPPLFDIEEAPA